MAQTAPKPAPAPPPAAALEPRASGLGHLVSEIVTGLGSVPSGAIVVASPLASDVAAPKGDELSHRVATQIAGRIAGDRKSVV